MRKGTEFWLRVTIVVFLGILLFFAPVVVFPFGISLFLAILLNPLAKFIQKNILKLKIKWFPYDFSIIISFIVFITIVYSIGVHIFVPFINELRAFIKSVPDTLNALQQLMMSLEKNYSLSLLPPEVKTVIARVIQNIGEYTLKLAQFSISAVFSVASTLLELIVVPFITFYFMKKGRVFKDLFISLFPERYSNRLNILFSEIYNVLHAYIRGQLLLSAIMTIFVCIGMSMFDIPYPLVIGLLAGVLEMIPIVGPIIRALPPIVLGLLQGTSTAIQVTIFYIFVQQLDAHLIMPKLMGSIIKVHPVVIIAGVLIGGQLYGVIGMMVSVPFIAVLQIVLRHMWFYERYK